MDLTISKLFLKLEGAQRIAFILLSKYTGGMDVLKSQEQQVQLLVGDKLQKDLKIELKKEGKVQNAPSMFFKEYPLMQEYIKIEANQDKIKNTDFRGVFHHQGPLVFYAVLIIILLQITQLLHYDMSELYNLRNSLGSILQMKSSGIKRSQYFEDITGEQPFSTWLNDTLANVLRTDSDQTANDYNLFYEKNLIIGEIILVKYDSKFKPCDFKGIDCIYDVYDDTTKCILLLARYR